MGRWLSPSTLILAGLGFVLPFVTVACDTPGGFGRAAPGATTTYTGFDLVLGDEPRVTPPEKVRVGSDERLWPQPAAGAALVLIVGALMYGVWTDRDRLRRGAVSLLSAVAAVSLLVNQALVEAELATRVGEQMTGPLPAGKGIRDLVQTGPGFVLCLLLLVTVALTNAVGWWLRRPRPALVAADQRPPQP